MERINQNLEFPQKTSAKSNECLERRSTKLFKTRPPCASGGDVAISEKVYSNSKSSSIQNITFGNDRSKDHLALADLNEEGEVARHFQCDVTSVPEPSRLNFSDNAKSKKKYKDLGSKLKAELSQYKKELKEYNNSTKDLEEKYMKINYELNEMQQKHDRFVESRKNAINESGSSSDSSSSTGSEFSLKRKYTQVFHRGSSFMRMVPPKCTSSNENLPMNLTQADESDEHQLRRKRRYLQPSEIRIRNKSPYQTGSNYVYQKRQTKRKSDNKENAPPQDAEIFQDRNHSAGLKDIYKVLQDVLCTNRKPEVSKGIGLNDLQLTINNLHNEQAEFRDIIKQQQSCLQDYQTRCIKAQQIMQSQHTEIDKLNSNNAQLETEITNGIEQLRAKVDKKLRGVAHLPQMMRDEQAKYEKVAKENIVLSGRLTTLQSESSQLKLKLEELGRRKVMTMTRLKTAERDLKIFKNYNTALKHEKRKLGDEMQKLKEQLENLQNSSKRSLVRQREQNEKQRRDLQKRVFELELKLSRSQNSTTSLIQERDSLIAELQTQLNSLVHNFEVSQKHIRVLRRHIYSMSGGNVRSDSRL